ncbi:unnamed protein product [Sphagnum troendelagicum]|uniref:HIT domain-containing protein n=3 Tax=Sphagnum TaxID=13804 RepID=A0ABP0ULD7_9BRYO
MVAQSQFTTLCSTTMAFWRWIWPASKKPQDCPFCLLSAGSTEGRTPSILFQDEQIVVFKDRSPASYRHYLAVPVHHIKNIQSLHQSEADYDLVAHMHKVGQSLLLRDAPDATGYRFGFHRPPFNSVDHLHLHCMALPYISWWKGFKYVSVGCLGSYVSAETVLKYLDSSGLPKGPAPQQDKPEMPV